MRVKHLSAVVLAAAIPAFAGQTQGPGAFTAASSVAIRNANVLNIRTGQVIPNTTVVVRDGRIASIGTAAPAGLASIDARGRYVVPGLMDAHTHIADFASARRALDSGVTTVRSAGVSHYLDVGLRELAKKAAIAGPDVVAAGYHVRP